MTEGRLPEAQAAFEGVGNAHRAERRLERRAHALERRAHDRDRLGRRPVAEEAKDLVGDELERAAASRALEEADRPFEGRRLLRTRVCEERPLQVREGGVGDLGVGRRQLLDPSVGEPPEVLGRPLQGGEDGTSGLVRKRDGDLRAAREPLQERPLRAGQVLEPVREDGAAVPRGEVALDAVDGAGSLEVPVGEAEHFELLAVGGVEPREVAAELTRVEERRLELGQGAEQAVGEAPEARGGPEPVQVGPRQDAADDERALRLRGGRAAVARPTCDQLEEVVERADCPAEQRRRAREQIALDTFDLRPDSGRREKARARARQGSDREAAQPSPRSPGRPTTGAAPSKSSPRTGRPPRAGQDRDCFFSGYAAALGRRPRRAAGRPGIWPAQSSQRSAALAPRRASA